MTPVNPMLKALKRWLRGGKIGDMRAVHIDERRFKKEVVDELNKERIAADKKPLWVEIKRPHALTSVEIDDEGNVKFFPEVGFIVKAMVNVDTGEMKLFPAILYEK